MASSPERRPGGPGSARLRRRQLARQGRCWPSGVRVLRRAGEHRPGPAPRWTARGVTSRHGVRADFHLCARVTRSGVSAVKASEVLPSVRAGDPSSGLCSPFPPGQSASRRTDRLPGRWRRPPEPRTPAAFAAVAPHSLVPVPMDPTPGDSSLALRRFQDLLHELFQFDCADLDFGIYRILTA